ncbi:MAG: glycoside hydrolase family 3 C-terminal domain-containing protein [Clostridia bacterium]|nr:glycoside hydrolase family 3 C-terminal domain-containing protein [Clostridia bacterium]
MLKKFEAKAQEIVSKMSLKEKIGQLTQLETPKPDEVEEFKAKVRRGEVGSILTTLDATAGNNAQGSINVDFYNELQRIAVEESPSGIPIIFGRDVIHGHRTVFPIPLAMSASFNPELIEESYRYIAKEAANESVHWTFTPMLDLSRDPRWGRIIEGTGEDPYVGARVAEAVVKGVQGEDISQSDKLLACAKHYVGYGASEGGRDYHRTEISDYSLYNYYLPAFKAAIKAGAKTVMSAFNDVNGQPITSSKQYLTDILRDKLGFDGFVVSDYDAVIQLKRQGVAKTDEDCAYMALTAGLDMDMHDGCYDKTLENLVLSGVLDEGVIDTAVTRVLTVKLYKGLFEKPYCVHTEIDRTEHLEAARKMAQESMVLLKNENQALPISKEEKIALIGPFSYERRSLLGSWTIDGRAEETSHLIGTMRGVASNVRNATFEGLDWDSTVEIFDWADVIVLALGESWSATGESRAVSTITISDAQKALIKKAKATGKKLIGVFFCGRPIAMQGIAEDFDAILYAWHSGSETANAVCDILFGDAVPSGKLPVTIPRLATHIPLYYNVTSSGRPVNCYYNENLDACYGACYVDGSSTPYYPFGYGLSYSEFNYGVPILDKTNISLSELKNGGKVAVSIDVENIGEYDCKETVQLYIHDPVAQMMRPIRELKGFKKPLILKGQSEKVEFELGFEDLGYYLANGDYIVEKGEIEIFIGPNCLTENKTVLVIN